MKNLSPLEQFKNETSFEERFKESMSKINKHKGKNLVPIILLKDNNCELW